MEKIFLFLGLTILLKFSNAQLSFDSAHSKGHRSSVITDGAIPRLISKQFTFAEGPANDKYGNIYFTDQPNNKIWKYSTSGRLSVFLDSAGRSNGLFFNKNGNLISCADEHNQVWSISTSGKVTILLKDFEGLHLNGPNDLWVHPTGGIYFTDPYYQRDYWIRRSPEIKKQNVYYLPGKGPAIIVDSTLVQPNGIVGTADGKYLYVADIGDNKTYKYSIAGNGTLTNRQLFTNHGSDGMTIDDKGDVYLTGNGVTVYNALGEEIGHIPITAKWTSNVTFGGKKKNQLFITATEAIYVINMKVRGVN